MKIKFITTDNVDLPLDKEFNIDKALELFQRANAELTEEGLESEIQYQLIDEGDVIVESSTDLPKQEFNLLEEIDETIRQEVDMEEEGAQEFLDSIHEAFPKNKNSQTRERKSQTQKKKIQEEKTQNQSLLTSKKKKQTLKNLLESTKKEKKSLPEGQFGQLSLEKIEIWRSMFVSFVSVLCLCILTFVSATSIYQVVENFKPSQRITQTTQNEVQAFSEVFLSKYYAKVDNEKDFKKQLTNYVAEGTLDKLESPDNDATDFYLLSSEPSDSGYNMSYLVLNSKGNTENISFKVKETAVSRYQVSSDINVSNMALTTNK
ncbi:hypothetical protein [Enterococcus sp. DIV0660C]|uniref:hypothetical protein n=1 Tax=Enterococcus sp. DIV0660C TaxID=2230880 RepID=UPI001A8CAC4F|nr:hypothetical protein [Enterococcus sp. DIV0660C]MBO0431289.1 hypothetical protein [Enterococcus sp. DIV0660C]